MLMSSDGFSIGVLATRDGILSGRIVDAMLRQGVEISVVLLDPAENNQRDLDIHEQRTGGRLPIMPIPDGVPVHPVIGHNEDDCVGLVKKLKLDLLVNAGTPRTVLPVLLKASSLGVLNCHPGRLPNYRGACAVEHAVLDNAPVANTVHLMTEGVDEGPILKVENTPLDNIGSYQDLRCAVYLHGCDLMARSTQALQSGQAGAADFMEQGDGVWHRPVDDASLAEIERRLVQGEYRPERSEELI